MPQGKLKKMVFSNSILHLSSLHISSLTHLSVTILRKALWDTVERNSQLDSNTKKRRYPTIISNQFTNDTTFHEFVRNSTLICATRMRYVNADIPKTGSVAMLEPVPTTNKNGKKKMITESISAKIITRNIFMGLRSIFWCPKTYRLGRANEVCARTSLLNMPVCR